MKTGTTYSMHDSRDLYMKTETTISYCSRDSYVLRVVLCMTARIIGKKSSNNNFTTVTPSTLSFHFLKYIDIHYDLGEHRELQ